jgi:hypothetical protein
MGELVYVGTRLVPDRRPKQLGAAASKSNAISEVPARPRKYDPKMPRGPLPPSKPT